jgi:multiple sugar transport system permease protein
MAAMTDQAVAVRARGKARTQHRAARWYGAAFVAPALIYLVALMVYPLGYSVWASLTNLRMTSPIVHFVGFDTYRESLANEQFHNSVVVTIIFLVASVTLETVLGFALALSFSRMRGSHPIMRALIMLPMMATPVTVGLIWKLMLNSDFGILGYVGELIGLGRILWLSEPGLALVSIIVMDIWQWTPFMFLILLAGLEGLPADLFEAARVDGAKSRQILMRITIPLMGRITVIAVAFRLMFAIATFDTVFVLTKGGPALGTDLITLFIQREGLVNLNIASASAVSFVVLAAVLIAVTLLFKRRLAHAR